MVRREFTIRPILTLTPVAVQIAGSGSTLVTGQDRFKLLVDIVKNLKEKGTVLCHALKLRFHCQGVAPVVSSHHARHCNLQNGKEVPTDSVEDPKERARQDNCKTEASALDDCQCLEAVLHNRCVLQRCSFSSRSMCLGCRDVPCCWECSCCNMSCRRFPSQ